MESIKTTKVIREVFGYIHRFQGQVFVIKINDDILDEPLFSLLIRDIVLIHQMGIKVILVPGTKNSINKVLDTYGKATVSHQGVRITSNDIMPLVKLGVSDVTNKLLTLLSEGGANGVLGNWVRAREIGVLQGFDYQSTGKVESVKLDVLQNLMDDNLIPILTNIGYSNIGKPYNISSSELAVFVAKAISASKLFFISSLNGIPKPPALRKNERRGNGLFSSVELAQAEGYLRDFNGFFTEEIRQFVEFAVDSIKGGVRRVHVINGTKDGIILQETFQSAGQGTMFHGNVHSNIRLARTQDVSIILHIMQPYVEQGLLVQRTPEMISEMIDRLYIYAVDDVVQACGALTPFSGQLAEIEAITVDSAYINQGIGGKLITYLIEKGRQRGLKAVFVLTTQSSDYFEQFGFKLAGYDDLPVEKQQVYNTNRNSKILLYPLQ